MGTNSSIATKKQRSSPLSLIWELFSAESKEIGVIFTYEIGVGILSLTIPIGVQVVVNTVAFTQLVQPVVFLSAAVLLGQLMGAFLRGIQVVLVEKLQRRLFSQIGMELAFRIPRMLRQRYSRFPELVNRFFDIVTIQKSVSSLVIEGFALALQILISLVLLAFYHPMLLAFDVFFSYFHPLHPFCFG
jgi:putative ABC transport system ATP-binding protein